MVNPPSPDKKDAHESHLLDEKHRPTTPSVTVTGPNSEKQELDLEANSNTTLPPLTLPSLTQNDSEPITQTSPVSLMEGVFNRLSPRPSHPPGSTTSLPAPGAESERRHSRRRRHGEGVHITLNSTRADSRAPNPMSPSLAVPRIPAPRRANSLPSPLMTGQEDSNPAPIRPPLPLAPSALKNLLQPQVHVKPGPTWKQCAINVVKYSYLNIILIFIPVAWASHFAHLDPTVIFCFSFISIIPLAALLGFATEELSVRLGPTVGGLLNATFGNAVELIISILALVKGELRVVQASMLGSILSNCLLILGMCFLAGGTRFHEQGYGVRTAQLQISLLSISVFSIVIPAAFQASLNASRPTAQADDDTEQIDTNNMLAISRGTSVILLIVYVAYLIFQLWTHSYLYTAAEGEYNARQTFAPPDEGAAQPPPGQSVFRLSSLYTHSDSTTSSSETSASSRRSGRGGISRRRRRRQQAETERTGSPPGGAANLGTGGTVAGLMQVESAANGHPRSGVEDGDADDEGANSIRSGKSKSSKSSNKEHEPKLHVQASLLTLLIVTGLTGFTAECLVDSIDGLTRSGSVNREFVALILLPLVGNAAEHVTAVTVSVKNKLDLAMTVAVGSSIQIALFVLPLLVLLGWWIGQPLSLFFDNFETIVVFASIIVVNYAIADGRTNWLEGFILMVIYVIIALSVWFYPGSEANLIR